MGLTAAMEVEQLVQTLEEEKTQWSMRAESCAVHGVHETRGGPNLTRGTTAKGRSVRRFREVRRGEPQDEVRRRCVQ